MDRLLLVCLTGLFLVNFCNAGKYNLTKVVAAPLVASHEHPGADCSVPGTCKPVNQTIPGQSLWYWCGWYSTHKTMYTLKSNSATANFSGSWMMRKSVLENCAIPNLATVENCPTVPETSCTSKRSCDVRGFALVFEDEMCFIIINNKASSIVGTLQIYNFYDPPRYYGTCFVLLITVVGGLAVLANVGYQIYKIILAPVSKYREPLRPRRGNAAKGGDGGGDGGGDAEKGTVVHMEMVQADRETWLSRFTGAVKAKLGRPKEEP